MIVALIMLLVCLTVATLVGFGLFVYVLPLLLIVFDRWCYVYCSVFDCVFG